MRSTHHREGEARGPQGRIRIRWHEYARGLRAQGHYEVAVAARDQRPARTGHERIASAPVWIAAPRHPRGQQGSRPLAMWGVPVREEDPPAHASALAWVLLTNVEVATRTQARERVGGYERRWTVEDFHQAQKPGGSIAPQPFPERSRREAVIGRWSVGAVEWLRVRNAARDPERTDRSALDFFPALSVNVRSAWRYAALRPLTVAEFYRTLARLGGLPNRKRDPPPGWLVLWRGGTKLESMAAGARAIEKARCG